MVGVVPAVLREVPVAPAVRVDRVKVDRALGVLVDRVDRAMVVRALDLAVQAVQVLQWVLMVPVVVPKDLRPSR